MTTPTPARPAHKAGLSRIAALALTLLTALLHSPLSTARNDQPGGAPEVAGMASSPAPTTVRVRAAHIAAGGLDYRVESNHYSLEATSIDYQPHDDYTIYDADTRLITDDDLDGFYHHFSLSIDADTLFDHAAVYARVYLSYEGAPWVHYATSDRYPIYADSSSDRFTIETELTDGFATGYYDIRIELFDAASDEWLLSYGPYEDDSLAALPLEDARGDEPVVIVQPVVVATGAEVVIEARGAHTGSMSPAWMLIPAMVSLRCIRRRRPRRGNRLPVG